MRQRLMQILSSDEHDERERRSTDAALLGFWGRRAKPLSPRNVSPQTPRTGVARVIDLAQWTRTRRPFGGQGPKTQT
jgi:hypothetical protein